MSVNFKQNDLRALNASLGGLWFGRLVEFTVIGDDRQNPTMVDLYAVIPEQPVHVLRIRHVDHLGEGATPLRAEWTDAGGMTSGTALATYLYAQTIRIVQAARKGKGQRHATTKTPT